MAKVVLELVTDTGPLTHVGDGLRKVSTEARKAGEDQRKAFKEGTKASNDAANAIKGFAGNINVAGLNVGQLAGKFGESQRAIGGVIRSMGLLKTALISTGIGALVVALGSLIVFFTKTEKGAEFLERATAALGAAFDEIIGPIAKFGETIFEAFENPKQALIDLGNFLKENIINRFKSFGVILEGIVNLDFKKVANGLLQSATGFTNVIDKAQALGTKMKAAADAAANLAREFQELEDIERANAVTISKNQKEIDKLLVQSKNRTLSEKQRLALLEQASKLEEENLALELAASNQRVSIIQRENERLQKLGLLRDEDADKLKDAIVARDNLEKASANLQEKIINRRDALNDELAQKALQRKENDAKAEAERLAKLKKAFDDETKLNEINFKRKEASLKSQLANGIIKEGEYNIRVNEAKVEALQQQIDTIDKFNKDGLELSAMKSETEIAIANTEADAKIAANQKVLDATKAAEAQAQKDAQEMQDAEDARIKKAQEDRIAIVESGADAISALIQSSMQEQEFNLENFSKQLIIIALDTLERIALLAAAEGLVKSVGTLGPIAGAIRGAVIATLIKAAFAAVKGAVLKGFKEGGYTGDVAENQVAGHVHGKEFVSTAKTTKKHRPLLEALHTEDYSKLKFIDLAPLLNGTGISLKPDVAENINIMHSQYSEQKTKRENALEAQVKSMQKDMNKFFKYYKSKPQESNLPDGSKVIKSGNTTRIVRKRK